MFGWLSRKDSAPELKEHNSYFTLTSVVGGQQLTRNGWGTRSRLGIKIYDVALYLPAKASSAEAALNMPGAKQIRLVARRNLPGSQLGNSLIVGIRNNLPEGKAATYLMSEMPRVVAVFTSQPAVAEGHTFRIDMVPGDGVTFFINDELKGEKIKTPGFTEAVLNIWLGNHPAEAGLKAAMLGQ